MVIRAADKIMQFYAAKQTAGEVPLSCRAVRFVVTGVLCYVETYVTYLNRTSPLLRQPDEKVVKKYNKRRDFQKTTVRQEN